MSNAARNSWPLKQAEDDTETLVQIYANRGFAPSTLRSIREKCLHRRLHACEKEQFAVLHSRCHGLQFPMLFCHSCICFHTAETTTPGFFSPCLPLWQGARCVCTVCVPRLKTHVLPLDLFSSFPISSGVGAHCQPIGHPDEDGAGRSETPLSLSLSSFLFFC